jgi:hypothetical protein
MKVGGLAALVPLAASCDNPVPLAATVETSATQNVAIGGRAQLVVKLTNTGPAIPHLGLVFMTADKWYEHTRYRTLAAAHWPRIHRHSIAAT